MRPDPTPGPWPDHEQERTVTEQPNVEKPTTDVQGRALAPGEGETNDPTDASETATYVAPDDADDEDDEDDE
jgi:hypothetical protein